MAAAAWPWRSCNRACVCACVCACVWEREEEDACGDKLINLRTITIVSHTLTCTHRYTLKDAHIPLIFDASAMWPTRLFSFSRKRGAMGEPAVPGKDRPNNTTSRASFRGSTKPQKIVQPATTAAAALAPPARAPRPLSGIDQQESLDDVIRRAEAPSQRESVAQLLDPGDGAAAVLHWVPGESSPSYHDMGNS
eukprot:m.131274 g.131274  ORF g.131274 m.131274 type:complete len:194 (+) comp9468_c0_seq1:1308-1889(+)